MKHFGHDCDAFEDKRIQRLVARHGLAGYGFYFACLELIGQKIKKNAIACELEYEPQDLAYKFRTDQELAEDYLSTCLEVGLFWRDDRTGKVYCFKILSRLEKNVGYNAEFKTWLEQFHASELYKYYLSTDVGSNLTNGSVLNGSKRTKQQLTKSKAKAIPSASPQGLLVDWFKGQFQDRFGKPYVASKADYVQLDSVIKSYNGNVEMLKSLVFVGWNTPDEKNGYSISKQCMTVKGFCSVVNKLTLKPPKPKTEYELEQEALKNANL